MSRRTRGVPVVLPCGVGERELFVVPKGVRHNPSAQDECLLMLLERKSTLHTGNQVTEKTRTLAERLAGFVGSAAVD